MSSESPSTASGSPFRITTPDGLSIAAQRHGTREGRAVIFIHGFSQSGLCWARQMESPALAHLNLVTYDFRGHGGSDKPLDPACYKAPERWAVELNAIIREAGEDRPVLVGWSYGGRVICDYLSTYGGGGLSGIVFVDAATANERRFYGTSNRLMRQMCSADLAENVAATRAFLARCTAVPLPRETFETLLAVNMVVPPQVRASLFDRPADYDDLLCALDLPVLVVQGALDQVVAPAMAEHIAGQVKGAEFSLYEDVGHAPFLEDAERFNRELATFVTLRVQKAKVTAS